MKKIFNYLFMMLLLPIASVGQVTNNYLKILNNTDSISYSTIPVIVTDTFSVIEIQKILNPVVCKCSVNGKPTKILKGTVVPEYRNQTLFFRRNQIYFIRLRKDNTDYGVISITKKKNNNKEKNNIVINNSYLFTIKPYNKENFVHNEKLYFKYEHEGVTFRVFSQDLFIENIYTTDNLEGLEYIEEQSH